MPAFGETVLNESQFGEKSVSKVTAQGAAVSGSRAVLWALRHLGAAGRAVPAWKGGLWSFILTQLIAVREP